MLDGLKRRAVSLNRELNASWIASRDPRTPPLANIIVTLVIAYAFSPIDLIPDFIPILGYLDDLVIIPAGIALAIRITPREVLQDARKKASEDPVSPASGSRLVAAAIITAWVVITGLAGNGIYRLIVD